MLHILAIDLPKGQCANWPTGLLFGWNLCSMCITLFKQNDLNAAETRPAAQARLSKAERSSAEAAAEGRAIAARLNNEQQQRKQETSQHHTELQV